MYRTTTGTRNEQSHTHTKIRQASFFFERQQKKQKINDVKNDPPPQKKQKHKNSIVTSFDDDALVSRVCCSRVALLILPMSSPASLSPPPDANAPSPPPVPGILITKVRVARQRARDDCSLCWSNRNVAEIAVWLNFVERILSFFLPFLVLAGCERCRWYRARGTGRRSGVETVSWPSSRDLCAQSKTILSFSLTLSLSFLL